MDFNNSTYCFNAKNFLNPLIGFRFSNLGDSADKENKNPVCKLSTRITIINTTAIKGANVNRIVFNASVNNMPTMADENSRSSNENTNVV